MPRAAPVWLCRLARVWPLLPVSFEYRSTSSQPMFGNTAVATASPDKSQRFVLCLVADEEVVERFPAVVRYLQVGLIDEPIDVILVLPDNKRALSLASGPTHTITHRKLGWPYSRWVQRTVIADVQERIEGLPKDRVVIVHGLVLSTAPLAAAIAEATGSELVLHVASTAVLNDLELMRRLERASALITPAAGIHRAIKASPLATKSAKVVHPGMVTGDAPAAFRDARTSPVLIYAGPLTEDCGADALLRSVRRVLSRHSTLQVFIIGKGPAEASLRHLAASLGISLNVTFTGRVEHLRSAMAAGDVFCLPRKLPVFREEPILALATGLAIVAVDGALCDGLVHRQTALLFPDRDEIQMTEHIDHLLENPEFARTMAATGQAHARSHYSVSRMVSDHVRIYRDLVVRHNTLSMPAGR